MRARITIGIDTSLAQTVTMKIRIAHALCKLGLKMNLSYIRLGRISRSVDLWGYLLLMLWYEFLMNSCSTWVRRKIVTLITLIRDESKRQIFFRLPWIMLMFWPPVVTKAATLPETFSPLVVIVSIPWSSPLNGSRFWTIAFSPAEYHWKFNVSWNLYDCFSWNHLRITKHSMNQFLKRHFAILSQPPPLPIRDCHYLWWNLCIWTGKSWAVRRKSQSREWTWQKADLLRWSFSFSPDGIGQRPPT